MVRSRKDSAPAAASTPDTPTPAAALETTPETPASPASPAAGAWWATATGADAPGPRREALTVPVATGAPTVPLAPSTPGVGTSGVGAGATSASAPAAPGAAPRASAPVAPRSWPGWGWALVSLAAVVVVSAAVALGVSSLVVSSESRTAAVGAERHAAGAAGAAGTGVTGGATRAQRTVIRGTVSAIDVDSVSIATAAGGTQTLRLTATTAYGTATKPATRADITVGDRVIALESRAADAAPTALRIVERTGA